jgi:hypothetical protein
VEVEAVVMALVEVDPSCRRTHARSYEEVVGKGPQGASPRGSTYWRRVHMWRASSTASRTSSVGETAAGRRARHGPALARPPRDVLLATYLCSAAARAAHARARGVLVPRSSRRRRAGTTFTRRSRACSYFTRWRDNNDWNPRRRVQRGLDVEDRSAQTARMGFEYRCST